MPIQPTARRLIWTVAGIALVAAALSGRVDALGHDYAASALTRVLVTFAVARTLDGVISAAQGTEIAVEPAGVGVSLTVGQVLDPINDLVERFSAVMLVAASSVGMQNLLLRMSGWWGMSAILIAAVALSLLVLWWPRLSGGAVARAARKILLLAVFLRFAMPVLLIGSDLIFNTFLSDEQAQATEILEDTRVEIQQLSDGETPDASGQAPSLSERLGAVLDSSLRAMNVSEQLERLQQRLSSATEEIINLIVLFVLETVILPLVFVVLIVGALRSFAERVTQLK